jgi:methylmalonyl-CoA epimerase
VVVSITGTDHVVIAVRDIEDGIRNWRDGLGLTLSHTADLSDVGIRQAFFTLADNTFIELVAPVGEESPLASILESRGEGIHVLALRVDNLEDTVASLQAQGVRLTGVGTPQVFIHPKAANGVMIQLWPKSRPHRWRENETWSTE